MPHATRPTWQRTRAEQIRNGVLVLVAVGGLSVLTAWATFDPNWETSARQVAADQRCERDAERLRALVEANRAEAGFMNEDGLRLAGALAAGDRFDHVVSLVGPNGAAVSFDVVPVGRCLSADPTYSLQECQKEVQRLGRSVLVATSNGVDWWDGWDLYSRRAPQYLAVNDDGSFRPLRELPPGCSL